MNNSRPTQVSTLLLSIGELEGLLRRPRLTERHIETQTRLANPISLGEFLAQSVSYFHTVLRDLISRVNFTTTKTMTAMLANKNKFAPIVPSSLIWSSPKYTARNTISAIVTRLITNTLTTSS